MWPILKITRSASFSCRPYWTISKCKSGTLGYNASQCDDCGYTELHNNSCRNRNSPNCQAVLKEVWVDKRKSEGIDAPYFHVVFTLPHELNSTVFCNQELLYHVHMHCIVSGGGLTSDGKIRKSKSSFFIPVLKLRNKFKGKYMALPDGYYEAGTYFQTSRVSEIQVPLHGHDHC